jgi:hypothetical protein
MAWSDDTLESDDDLEELLAEADDPGPGDWLQDLDAIENDYKGQSEG